MVEGRFEIVYTVHVVRIPQSSRICVKHVDAREMHDAVIIIVMTMRYADQGWYHEYEQTNLRSKLEQRGSGKKKRRRGRGGG